MRLIKNKSENMTGGYFKVWFDIWGLEKELDRIYYVLEEIEKDMDISYDISGDGEDITTIVSIKEEVEYSEISQLQKKFNRLYITAKKESKKIKDYEV